MSMLKASAITILSQRNWCEPWHVEEVVVIINRIENQDTHLCVKLG
jgi:hypothetical protein